MPVITVELPEEEIERLTVEAERRHMSVPALVAERVRTPESAAPANGASTDLSDEEFDEIVSYVINKNRELLERLA